MNTAVDSARKGASQVVERLAQVVGASAGESSVFGEAIERDGTTIIPVARSRWGFGGGSGEAKGGKGETGSGGGGGAIVRPLGFIEISEGHARFRRIIDPSAVAGAILAAGVLGLLASRRRRASRNHAGACGRRAPHPPEPTATVSEHAPTEGLRTGEPVLAREVDGSNASPPTAHHSRLRPALTPHDPQRRTRRLARWHRP